MGSLILVQDNGVKFLVEVRDNDSSGGSGASTAGLADRLDLQGVSDTVKVIAQQLKKAWADAKPDEAQIEFGLDVTVKSGKLTGILVDGEANAALKVTLTWKSSGASLVSPAVAPAATS